MRYNHLMITEKQCTRCLKIKPTADFSICSNIKSKLRSECRQCGKDRWRRKHPIILTPDLPQEEWRSITGYEGYYSISNCGRVRREKASLGATPGRILKTSNRGNYPRVGLCINNVTTHYHIHRLVADAFLPPDPVRLQINHIDGNPQNNHISNLERCTPSENYHHAMYTLERCAIGEKHYNVKLTSDQVVTIRRELQNGVTGVALAKQFNVTPGAITAIKHRRIWKHIPE